MEFYTADGVVGIGPDVGLLATPAQVTAAVQKVLDGDPFPNMDWPMRNDGIPDIDLEEGLAVYHAHPAHRIVRQALQEQRPLTSAERDEIWETDTLTLTDADLAAVSRSCSCRTPGALFALPAECWTTSPPFSE